MILLEEKYYGKASERLQQVIINNLFARAVAERRIAGKIFVDNELNPGTFYVVHPYGMTLLFGDSANLDFNSRFKEHALNKNGERNNFQWMQAYPDSWDETLQNLFHDCLIKSSDNTEMRENGVIELNTRLNFSFNRSLFLANRMKFNNPDIRIIPADGKIFRDMNGSVVPKYFWNSEDDFLENGIAFALLYKNELASTAFTAYRFGNQFELGIETKQEYRKMGFAQLVCSELIGYCIKNGYEPLWSCREENTGSCLLAAKLGFEVTRRIPYYRLSN